VSETFFNIRGTREGTVAQKKDSLCLAQLLNKLNTSPNEREEKTQINWAKHALGFTYAFFAAQNRGSTHSSWILHLHLLLLLLQVR
jgi:hypothetical protein